MTLQLARRRSACSLALVVLFLLVLGFLAEPALGPAPALAEPAPAQGSVRIVERWTGTTYQETGTNRYAPCPWVCEGFFHKTVQYKWDLQVDDSGFAFGVVESKVQGWDYQQSRSNIHCGPVAETDWFALNCRYATTMTQPNGLFQVEGQRTTQGGRPVLQIKIANEVEECEAHWTGRGIRDDTGAPHFVEDDASCGAFVALQTYQIQTYLDGRAPRISMNGGFSNAGGWERTSGYLTGAAEEPILELDREFLERSVFLSQVPVDETMNADVEWNSADDGYVTWQFEEAPPEEVGPTRDKRVPKQLNVGEQSTGRKRLTVQAKNTLEKVSQPEATLVTVAPPPPLAGAPSNISAKKMGEFVAYKFSAKFPDPPFKAGVDFVPRAVPFFGGGPFGVPDTQLAMELEVKSSGEGSLQASTESGFQAMKKNVKLRAALKGQVRLDNGGVKFQRGEFELRGRGTIEAKESLIVAIPAVGVFLARIADAIPAARALAEKAQLKVEAEPRLAVALSVRQNSEGYLEWERGRASPGLAFKISVVFDLVEDVLSASAGVGGEAVINLQVPPPYFQGGYLKLLATAKVVFWRFAREFEASHNIPFIPAAQAATIDAGAAFEDAVDSGWVLLDRDYLDDSNYARWAGGSPASYHDDGPHDQLLAENVYPQANPSLDARISQFGYVWLTQAWTHDKPGVPALSAGEIAYSRKTGTGPGYWSSRGLLTNDEHDDFNPQVALLPDETTMMLWQRVDTPTPPPFDPEGNPRAYLSHVQVAACALHTCRFTPRQLSASGSLNFRPQLGATDEGALAVWVNNPANQVVGDADNPDRILAARYLMDLRPAVWMTPTVVLEDVVGLMAFDLATNGPHAALVLSLDRDGDFRTHTDQELFYLLREGDGWSAPARLTNNDVPDEAPELALTAEGTPLLVWRQGGALKFLNGRWNGTPTSLPLLGAADRLDYELDAAPDGSLALTWQEVEPAETRIGYALYDGVAGSWSAERTIPIPDDAIAPGQNGMALAISPVLAPPDPDEEDARPALVATYALAHVEAVTETVDGVRYPNVPRVGQHDLRVATVPLVPNLTVTSGDLRVMRPAGGPPTLQAAIHNSGDLPVQDVPVTLFAGQAQAPVTTRLLPMTAAGSVVTLTFPLSGNLQAAGLYTLRIDPENALAESNESDNSAALGSEIAITSLPVSYTAFGATLQALVSRGGPIYPSLTVSSTLTLDQPDGEIVGAANVSFPITPTATVSVTAYISPTRLGPGHHLLYWTVDPEGSLGETNTEDNVTATTLSVLPDMTSDPALIGFGRAAGASAPFVIEVQNVGVWPSEGGVVEVFDAVPGRPGTHSLLRLPLPRIQPGATAVLAGTLRLVGLPAATAGLSGIYVEIDPAGAVEEIDENNNSFGAGELLVTGEPGGGGIRLYLPMLRR